MGLKLEKETITFISDSTGRAIELGDDLIFSTNEGKVMGGRYKGIANRGALKFVGWNELENVEFHVMPKSIKDIYHFD